MFSYSTAGFVIFKNLSKVLTFIDSEIPEGNCRDSNSGTHSVETDLLKIFDLQRDVINGIFPFSFLFLYGKRSQNGHTSTRSNLDQMRALWSQ